MAEYWRKRPVIEAISFEGDLQALTAWLTDVVAASPCSNVHDVVVEQYSEDGGPGTGTGFRILWNEGYVGAETMQTRGELGDMVAFESCWFYSHPAAGFSEIFEPVQP